MEVKLDGMEMKVAVIGGHGCNLSLCRSLVALRILVRATMTLCLLTADLTFACSLLAESRY